MQALVSGMVGRITMSPISALVVSDMRFVALAIAM